MTRFFSARMQARLDVYKSHGGRTSRRKTARTIVWFVQQFAQRPVEQLGNRQVHELWEYLDERDYSLTTQLDYYRAVCVIWRDLLQRPTLPPRPHYERARISSAKHKAS